MDRSSSAGASRSIRVHRPRRRRGRVERLGAGALPHGRAARDGRLLSRRRHGRDARSAAYRADPRAGMLLTGDIATMRRLAERTPAVDDGERRRHPSSRPGARSGCATSSCPATRQRRCATLATRGVNVTAQDVPGARCRSARGPARMEATCEHRRAAADRAARRPARARRRELSAGDDLAPAGRPRRSPARSSGQPSSGLLVGAALELIALETLPFGASRYPEWGSAAVVGGAIFADASVASGGRDDHRACSPRSRRRGSAAGRWSSCDSGTRLGSRVGATALEAGARGAVISLQLWASPRISCAAACSPRSPMPALSPLADATVGLWTTDARLSRALVVATAASVAARRGVEDLPCDGRRALVLRRRARRRTPDPASR